MELDAIKAALLCTAPAALLILLFVVCHSEFTVFVVLSSSLNVFLEQHYCSNDSLLRKDFFVKNIINLTYKTICTAIFLANLSEPVE